MSDQFPRVSASYSNGNLLAGITVIDGIAGIVGTAQGENIGNPKQVFSLVDAVSKGFTQNDEPFLYRQIKEFYDELAGNQELWVMGTAETMTMAQALDNTDPTAARALVAAAGGRIRLLGVCRAPDNGYSPGDGFFDEDVAGAVNAANIFGQARLVELIPLRILVEGRVTNENSEDIFQPNTAACDWAGVVMGGSQDDGSASIGTVLGRAVKYAAHIKIGKVANGPLAIQEVYIGSQALKDYLPLGLLHSYGIISFMTYFNRAGIYLGIDRMANESDYRLLAYGRVIDKAALISAAVYQEELESEVDVDDQGNIAEIDVKHLEKLMEQQMDVQMGNQISGRTVYIDPAQDIIDTSHLQAAISVRPKGYASFIDVVLGLQSPAVQVSPPSSPN